MVKVIPFIDTSINAVWDDWQNYPNGRPNPLYAKQAEIWGVDGLIFGFITLSAKKKACWAAQDTMPLNWSLPLAKELALVKKETIVSFGGASNPDISSEFSIEELIQTYLDIIEMYNPSGLDFDLENGLYNADKISSAISVVKSKYPECNISLTLPTMPTGLTNVGLGLVSTFKKGNFNFMVNGMAMDYYSPEAALNMGQAAVDAVKSITSQLVNLNQTPEVGITPMIGLNDDLSMFHLKDAQFLASQSNNLNFLSYWSFNRDNPSSFPYVDLQSSSNPEQKESGEYAKIFVKTTPN
ncbi:Chitinase [Invertebrate iridescent virus 22]|uniref:Chitinase n=1 Tax=Invertebrate iridescent virus 22 TaxID=345198 RepID=W8W1C8_9VIRU|nr:Chitinase [Invertebrate iridescent virus 22]CCV01928.1 Chitinase [Invertebrate iridescent virus 22]